MFFRRLFGLAGNAPGLNRSAASSLSSPPRHATRRPLDRRPLRLEPLEDRRMLSVLRVDADSTAALPNGLAWSTAYPDLQDALDRAAALNTDAITENDVTQIWIAEGTYHPTAELDPGDARSASFSLLDGVSLYGGFAGDETALDQRDLSARTTTLSGDLGVLNDDSDNAYTVVYCGENIETTIDGFSITDGNANGDPASTAAKYSGGGI